MQKRKLKGNERTARELELVELIGATTDKATRTAYYDELYKSLRPVMYKVFTKIGAPRDYEDLWQEMYFALVSAVDNYNDPKQRKDFPFISFAMTKFHQTAYRYYAKNYRINEKIPLPLSLNADIKANRGGDRLSLMDMLQDPTDVAEEIADKLIDEEKLPYIPELWAEVDALPPKQADAIRRRFIEGRTFEDVEKNPEARAFYFQVKQALENLKDNPRVQHIALAYDILRDTSLAYRGGFKFFKEHQASSVEYVVLLAEEREEERRRREAEARELAAKREKAEAGKGSQRLFKLRDTSIFYGQTVAQLAEQLNTTGNIITQLRRGRNTFMPYCEKIAAALGKPFDEIFIETTPKVNATHAACFVLRGEDKSMFFTKCTSKLGPEIGVSATVVENLRKGKSIKRESAEKVAAWVGKPFDEFFKPVTDV